MNIKIFYIITSLDYGGTQKNLYYILKNLPKNYKGLKFVPFLVSLKKNGRFKKKFVELGVKLYDLNLPLMTSLATIFVLPYSIIKFFYLVIKHKPNLIHSFLFQANFLSRFAKLVLPKTKIICSERVAEKQKIWQHILLRLTNWLVDFVTVNSERLREFVIQSQKVERGKVILMHNIIDQEEIKITAPAKKIREEIGLTEKDFVVLSVGRLHKQKGFDLFIEIAKEFCNKIKSSVKNHRFLFVIVGDGEEYNLLVRYAEELNVEDYVKFLGYKENVYDYINACDVFLLTSYWEGCPNVILEAISLGKIVVSTKVEGVDEILKEEFLVNLQQDRKIVIKDFVEIIYRIYEKTLLEDYRSIKCAKEQIDLSIYNKDKVLRTILPFYIDKVSYIL
ncbi:MAG: glycosyltransferase [Endomicrobia bacterium]|nr:glycosyltransferase [Endomicrobiia bacterium]